MSTTSKKHASFVSEPMGEKPVTDIAGIGETYGKRLNELGFEKAYNLLGQFLLLNKDEENFKEWLKEEVSMNGKHLNDCCACMSEWTRSYV
jgi:hypothetical protein